MLKEPTWWIFQHQQPYRRIQTFMMPYSPSYDCYIVQNYNHTAEVICSQGGIAYKYCRYFNNNNTI